MEGQPNIHFIKAESIEECEIKVNSWIDDLPFMCSVLGINVLPMILDGRMLFLGVVTFTKQPSYINGGKLGAGEKP